MLARWRGSSSRLWRRRKNRERTRRDGLWSLPRRHRRALIRRRDRLGLESLGLLFSKFTISNAQSVNPVLNYLLMLGSGGLGLARFCLSHRRWQFVECGHRRLVHVHERVRPLVDREGQTGHLINVGADIRIGFEHEPD